MTLQDAEKTTILRCVAGSESTGTSVGGADRDELGIFIEPLSRAHGFHTTEQFVYRDAEKRTGKADAASEPGDLDLTLYTLRKFLSLAIKGNPTIISLLFAPSGQCLVRSKEGEELQALAPSIIHKGTAGAFLGYMKAQRERLLGLRGGKDVNRPELVKQYGYDTKFAAHMIRLGLQGVELMETGKMTLPMEAGVAADIRSIRVGGFALKEVVEWAENLESILINARDKNSLPKEADVEKIEKWMLNVYMDWWTQDELGDIMPLLLAP
jgi:predicted nucleotidyltransferase